MNNRSSNILVGVSLQFFRQLFLGYQNSQLSFGGLRALHEHKDWVNLASE